MFLSYGLSSATFLGGFIYAVTPGPAFLAVFALSARHGRKIGARFLLGHLAGDVLWGGLALAAIVGANALGPALFELLGFGCGIYLIWLGLKAIRSRDDDRAVAIGSLHPIKTGILFGLTNPKAYPVSLAVFTSLTMRYASEIGIATAPALMAAAIAGLLLGYVAILFWAGLPTVRRFFLQHGQMITRMIGVTFVAFGLKSIGDAGHSLASRV